MRVKNYGLFIFVRMGLSFLFCISENISGRDAEIYKTQRRYDRYNFIITVIKYQTEVT